MTEFECDLQHITLRGQANHQAPLQQEYDEVVLAFHGWQDNSSSFTAFSEELAAHLPVLAFDWPGHGRSDWRSADAHYYFIDYLYDLAQVLKHIKAQRIHLVGHSLGAMVASLAASCYGEKINSMCLIEGFGLLAQPAEQAKEHLMKALKHRERNKAHRQYQSSEEIIKRRAQLSDFDEDISKQLMLRNIKQSASGVTLHTDPRIKHASAFRYTPEQVHALLGEIEVPTLLIKGSNGYELIEQSLEKFSKHYKSLKVTTVDGGHHCHMQSPKQTARQFTDFIAQKAAS